MLAAMLQVRSLQMFSTPVRAAAAGDRAAMALTQLDASQVFSSRPYSGQGYLSQVD